MVEFETFVDEGETNVCGRIATDFSDELNDMFDRSFDTLKEHCVYFYKDSQGLGSTSMGTGVRGGIPKEVKLNARNQVPDNVEWAVYVHTHPPGSVRASVSDMFSFSKETHDTVFDESKPNIVANFILTNIPGLEGKELVLFGFNKRARVSEAEVRSTMLTLEDSVERQNQIFDTGDIEAMNSLIEDSMAEVQQIATLCWEEVETTERIIQ